MNRLERIVIVGAGQAAVQAIDVLRRRGYGGSLVLTGEEPELPYQRPPLSKKYLAGTLPRSRLLIRPEAYFTQHSVEARLGCRIEEIDRRAQRVRAEDGSSFAYDALLIATGSRARPLPVPGCDLSGVHYLRSVRDADRLGLTLRPGRRLVIIGAGYIGLEAAATALERGVNVTVLEMADRTMKRVVSPEISRFYESEHARLGVEIVCDARVRAIAGDLVSRDVRSVLCEDGSEYLADLVLIGVGAAAEERLAVNAGLECANGIVVDGECRTSDPQIFAAGDCTSHLSDRYRRRVRLESVDNAFDQGTNAALALLGEPVVHDKVPWFWSEQYDLKLVIVGLSEGHDATVLRGDPTSRSFSVCYLRERELIAIDTVNSPRDQMAARKLVAARVQPNIEKLADPHCSLKDSV